MNECYMCRKPLTKESGKIKLDNALFCFACAPQWDQRRKQQALTAINENGPLVELFHISQAIMANPDNPNKNHLVGDIVFMEKGVCFVQLADFEVKQQSGAMLFGMLGSMIDMSIYRKAKNKAAVSYDAQVKLLSPEGLLGMLMGAPRLIFVPKNEIQNIKYSRMSGMVIDTGNKATKRVFTLEGGKKAYQVFESQIRDYLGV